MGRFASIVTPALTFILIAALTFSSGYSRAQAARPAAVDLGAFVKALCDDLSAPPGSVKVTPEFCGMEPRTIRLIRSPDDTVVMSVLVADDGRERAAGYQNIDTEIIRQTAILFIFPRPVMGAFHMCNVGAPLDIAWIDPEGLVLDVQHMKPGPRKAASDCDQLYSPRTWHSYGFALETPAGVMDQREILPGTSRLLIEDWMSID